MFVLLSSVICFFIAFFLMLFSFFVNKLICSTFIYNNIYNLFAVSDINSNISYCFLLLYDSVLFLAQMFFVSFLSNCMWTNRDIDFRCSLLTIVLLSSLNRHFIHMYRFRMVLFLIFNSVCSYYITFLIFKNRKNLPLSIFFDYVTNFYLFIVLYVILFIIKYLFFYLSKCTMLFVLMFRSVLTNIYLTSVIKASIADSNIMYKKFLLNIFISGVFYYLKYTYAYIFIFEK